MTPECGSSSSPAGQRVRRVRSRCMRRGDLVVYGLALVDLEASCRRPAGPRIRCRRSPAWSAPRHRRWSRSAKPVMVPATVGGAGNQPTLRIDRPRHPAARWRQSWSGASRRRDLVAEELGLRAKGGRVAGNGRPCIADDQLQDPRHVIIGGVRAVHGEVHAVVPAGPVGVPKIRPVL